MGTGTGLATAFFRFYFLHALERGPRPARAVLASLHSREGPLPLESGAFSRALGQLLDAGLVVPAEGGCVELTALGRREREAQRPVWQRLCAIIGRLLAGELPSPEPPEGGGVPRLQRAPERMSDAYHDRVVLAQIREAARRAREREDNFGIALAEIAVSHPQPLRARAMLQRALRETLGRAASTFAAGACATRFGPQGVCLIVPGEGVEAQAELLRARLLESLGAMSATVQGFAGARYAAHAGAARWTRGVTTSAELLRLAEEALARDQSRGVKAA